MKKAWKKLALIVSCSLMPIGQMAAYADTDVLLRPIVPVTAQEDYSNIAVSQVSDYVNVRASADTDSEIVGKIYNNCAAIILETVSGEGGNWYRIQSGTVNGYIKAQYFITGDRAEALARQIGREFVTVNAEGLRLREKPDLDSDVLTQLSSGTRYLVQEEKGGFYKIEVDADLIGYIATQYCKTQVEFDEAVSLEEERQKLDEEARRKQEAETAIAALEKAKLDMAAESDMTVPEITNYTEADLQQGDQTGDELYSAPTSTQNYALANPSSDSSPSMGNGTSVTTGAFAAPGTSGAGSGVSALAVPSSPALTTFIPGSGAASAALAAVTSATRTAIVAYAKQFLGNPYVYGGTSLTNGADCSGFTQGVFGHFGIETGRTSRDQADNGRTIALDQIQPGDLLFYSSGSSGYINHVAIYIGNGQIIHSSTEKTGICTAPYDYRSPCKAVTFF